MPSLELKNFTTYRLKDKNQSPYYLIKDNQTDQVYFCFQQTLKEGWEELEKNYQTLRKIEVEYLESEKGNKVIRLWGGSSEFLDGFLV